MFDKVVGNTKVQELLHQALKTGTLPQVLLFYGAQASKVACAHAIATHFLETESSVIEKKSHPDFYPMCAQEQGYSIEAIRKLSRELNKPPFLAKKKVVIFYDAHNLSTVAQNALLKTIEEPLKDTTFIFITKNRAQLLPTMLSRMVAFCFQRVLEKEAISYLIQQFALPTKKAKRAVRLANGCLEKASCIAIDKEPLLPLVIELLSCFDYLAYQKIVEKITALPQEQLEDIFFYILVWYRDLLVTPEHFLAEELPKIVPKQTLFTIEKHVRSLENAHRLHMKLADCLEVLFLMIMQDCARPA